MLGSTVTQTILRLRGQPYPPLDCDPAVRPHLERILANFVDGYHLALASETTAQLVRRLDEMEPDARGFAYEGAGMLLALMDLITPWKQDRVHTFLAGAANSHDYIVCIGVGFALARVPWSRCAPQRFARRYGAGYAALVLDGFGFHEGFFHAADCFDGQRRPAGLGKLDGLAARCFDAGLGRALWFVRGASPERIRETILGFPDLRQGDLWAGLGLAAAYAGSAYPNLDFYAGVLRRLAEYAGPHQSRLKLGVVFAAETRRKGANPTPWTRVACEDLLNMPFEEAAHLGLAAWESACCDLNGRSGPQAVLQVHRLACDRVVARLERQSPPVCSAN
jgi:enediyne biosynthesis protein E3